MGQFSRKRLIHRKSSNSTDLDCFSCRGGSSTWAEFQGSTLVFTCGDNEVDVNMFGFEDFDIERAQEVVDTLRDILDVDGIKWEDHSTTPRELGGMVVVLLRTHIIYRGKFYSVIIGTGTYGGENYRLELMSDAVNNGDPIGSLTVTEVIDILKNGYNPKMN